MSETLMDTQTNEGDHVCIEQYGPDEFLWTLNTYDDILIGARRQQQGVAERGRQAGRCPLVQRQLT